MSGFGDAAVDAGQSVGNRILPKSAIFVLKVTGL